MQRVVIEEGSESEAGSIVEKLPPLPHRPSPPYSGAYDLGLLGPMTGGGSTPGTAGSGGRRRRVRLSRGRGTSMRRLLGGRARSPGLATPPADAAGRQHELAEPAPPGEGKGTAATASPCAAHPAMAASVQPGLAAELQRGARLAYADAGGGGVHGSSISIVRGRVLRAVDSSHVHVHVLARMGGRKRPLFLLKVSAACPSAAAAHAESSAELHADQSHAPSLRSIHTTLLATWATH